MSIEAIQVEHYETALGIGHSRPRLSWRYAPTKVAWKQTACEIGITLDGSERVHRVDGPRCTLVAWPERPLRSREMAKVRVRALGEASWTDWQETTLETGLLERSDWQAEMISCPAQPVQDAKPPFYLRKRFSLASVGSSRLYCTAHGIYEVEINGTKVGDHVLAPGWTSYSHHLNYQVFDVTSLLRAGENVIGAHVAEGWYAGRLGRPGDRNEFGSRLGFMGQLEVEGVVVVTDASWEWLESSVRKSELYDGEVFDSQMHDAGWSTASAAKQAQGPAEITPFPSAALTSSQSPPMRRKLEIGAREIITTPSGKTVIDFGQNLVGWVRLNEQVQGGEMVLRHAEVLEDGELGVRPLRTAKCTDTVILGGPVKGWEPKFTFHGFRYVEVTGISVSLNTFTAIAIWSDMRPTGTFTSSHASLNQLHQNVVWGMRGNFVSVPTDCPQRDERMGWTGDIQVFAQTANYLYDTSGFLSAWLKDVSAETVDYDGIVPIVVPFLHGGGTKKPHPQPAWADCIAMTPWDLYTAFGDDQVLRDNYDAMRLWLDKGVPRGEDGLWNARLEKSLYADWLDPHAPPDFPSHGQTDTHFVANAYLVYVTGLVAKIAEVLGEDSTYREQYENLLATFQNEYVTRTGRLAADTQTAFALALKFNLLEPATRAHAAERLDYLIRWNWFKISTGFAGTPILLPVLAENGMLQLAYRMLQERDCPSWLYPVTMGATTIWERWDSMLPDGKINPGQMTSFNHYALGSVAHFLHTVVGGLSAIEPGWTYALVQPRPGGTVTSANTSFSSPIGTYSVAWRLQGDQLHVNVTVPPNGRARVSLPGVDEDVPSGQHAYTVSWAQAEWPPKGIKGPQSRLHPDNIVG